MCLEEQAFESYRFCLLGQVFQDLLWSDPQEKLGWEANPRGAGIKWGPNLKAVGE